MSENKKSGYEGLMKSFQSGMEKVGVKSSDVMPNGNNIAMYEKDNLLPPKKIVSEKKKPFSVKLKPEVADRLITLSHKENYAITDLIENALKVYLDSLSVVAEEAVVKKYEESKKTRKVSR